METVCFYIPKEVQAVSIYWQGDSLCFGDSEDVIMIDNLEKRKTVNKQY